MINNANKSNLTLAKFLRDFTYTFMANLFQLVISALVVLIIPKYFGVKDYSYWQLYLLYYTYVGIIQLGWCDGVYLRYGGQHYDELDRNRIATQVGFISGFYAMASYVLLRIINLFFVNNFNIDILTLTVIAGFLTTPRGLLFYVLLGTNKIKEYAKMNIIERVAFLIALMIFFLIGYKRFEYIILADLMGKLVSLLGTIYICRDLVFVKYCNFKLGVKEAFLNIDAGIKLMIANIASSLILGIVRFSIGQKWGIEVFGKISLTLSISNLLMIFINAVGIVIFPILKRISEDKLKFLYNAMRNILMAPLLFLLIFYYPMKSILSFWLPQYSESLKYMALLFPLVIFESKMAMLINTYLKALRQEKNILLVNILTVFLSLFTTGITVYVFDNLMLAIISIVILLAFRSIIAEFMISRVIDIDVKKDIILEIILSCIFMYSSWYITGLKGVLLYLTSYCVYLYIKKDEMKKSIRLIKNIN